ncbi:GTPase Era [Blastomonas fulva]|uniref:GTPase Era n=1 Tax=Blastomonas fulva TaxID=1550728 RepID=A0ABN5B9L4_9SPHN|nr:GTPase Era [Blastomonas fulva]ASR52494.1 GTPase Era [Blastomonas fulva]
MTDTTPAPAPASTRCGLVAVIGAPNAGKSTLVNQLVGQKVAITSPKAQTTRVRLLGIAIAGNTQLMLVDTPGIFDPNRRFDRAMVSAAWEGSDGADVIALVVDAKAKLNERLTTLVEQLATRRERKILVLNKVDIAAKDKLLIQAQKLHAAGNFDEVFFVSAQTGDGVPELKAFLADAMPEGAWHFPEDQVSDASERILATEITREQLFNQLHAELPYASAVVPEKYVTRKDGSVEIHQQILVARDTQRAIVLGKGGSRIKEIGEKARTELAKVLGVDVHLYLHVKVQEGWDEDREIYETIGLGWVK